jgi:hypothetical protein
VNDDLVEARKRAADLLGAFKYLDVENAAPTASVADVRALARLTLELADRVEGERSARRAVQEQRDEGLAVIARLHERIAEGARDV